MSVQLFLYQGLAGLYEELSTIQIKGGNIWNTPRDMMIYIYINIFISAEQLIKPRLCVKFLRDQISKTSFTQTKMKRESTVTHNLQKSQVLIGQDSQLMVFWESKRHLKVTKGT